MSELYQSLSHSKWDCKYHVVFVPKRRRKVIFGQTRRHLGQIFHALARQKECQILEGHLMPDHVHMCITIPPKQHLWHSAIQDLWPRQQRKPFARHQERSPGSA
jgi:putative transposase